MPALAEPTASPDLPQPPNSGPADSKLHDLLRREIAFIPNASFRVEGDADLEQTIESLLRPLAASEGAPADLPAHLRRMCDSELLSPEKERALFQAMNYLKFRAASLRDRLDPAAADSAAVAKIETLLDNARSIRDHLIQANTRLVISIVKKFVTPQQSFDEMLSDGIMILMQAVDKFDFDRGFRFSTYAYRSIARNAYRSVNIARREEAMFSRDAEAWAFEQPDHRSSLLTDQLWSNLRELTASMLEQLDRRERFIVRCRYALGPHRKARTFQYMADKLGVSKERARQLERRAVAKLQAMASEQNLDELFGAAMS